MPLRNSRNNVDARQSVITEIHGNQVNIRADASAPETSMCSDSYRKRPAPNPLTKQ